MLLGIASGCVARGCILSSIVAIVAILSLILSLAIGNISNDFNIHIFVVSRSILPIYVSGKSLICSSCDFFLYFDDKSSKTHSSPELSVCVCVLLSIFVIVSFVFFAFLTTFMCFVPLSSIVNCISLSFTSFTSLTVLLFLVALLGLTIILLVSVLRLVSILKLLVLRLILLVLVLVLVSIFVFISISISIFISIFKKCM